MADRSPLEIAQGTLEAQKAVKAFDNPTVEMAQALVEIEALVRHVTSEQPRTNVITRMYIIRSILYGTVEGT